MSDLETQIKELERKLALKKAYLSVDIKLPKGTSEELRLEIEQAVKTFCSNQANEVPQSSGGSFVGSPFNDQEIAILKELAQAVTQKSGGQSAKTASSIPKKPEANKPLMAVLMTTDNIAAERRKLIASNERVQVVSYNDKEVCFMYQKNRFVVPVEDVEFENQ